MAPSNIVVFNSIQYPLAQGYPVHERSLNQFPAKVVFGDITQKDLSIASEWPFLSDQRGGAGVQYFKKNQNEEDFAYSDGMETSIVNKFFPQVQTEDDGGDVVVDINWMGQLRAGGDYVFALGATTLYRRTGTGGWPGHNLAAGSVTGPGTSISSFRGTLYAWYTSHYQTSVDAGSVWVDRPSIRGVYAVEYDGKLVKIDAYGSISYTTKAPATTAADWIPVNGGVSLIPDVGIRGMVRYRDRLGRPAIIIGTNRGAWILDWASKKVYPFYPANEMPSSSEYHCRAMAVWGQDLYISFGRSLIRLTGEGAFDVGIEAVDDIQVKYRGRITALMSTPRYLYMAMDTAGVSTRQGSIWKWNGSGWHFVAGSGTNNAAITSLVWAGNPEDNILSFGMSGADTGTKRMKFLDDSEDPTDRLDVAQGFLLSAVSVTTPFFDAGLKGVNKTALDVVVEVGNVRADASKVQVHYAVNDSSTYNPLGDDITIATLGASSGEATLEFASGAGEVFRNISIRVTIDDAGDATTLPTIVRSAKLRFKEGKSGLRAVQLTVDVGRSHNGLGPKAMRDALWTANDLETLAPLQLYNPSETFDMTLASMHGVRNAVGRRLPGKYNLIFSEIN